MKPTLIRAVLVNGYITSNPWTPTIDGIVAYASQLRKHGDEFYVHRDSEMVPVDDLPIEKIEFGGRWWYSCSTPYPVDSVGRQKRNYHRRFDDRYEGYLVSGVGKVLTKAGPYKAARLADTRTICRAVEWHVVGDREALRDLLGDIDQIGAARAVGFGSVVEWQLEDGDAEIARRRRPLPLEYAESIGIAGRRMSWGIVPPTRLPESICECVMP
ncbi:hypothetical protein [Methylosinus sp. PW1]|uniref:hypothetical protein n=1 Tax=Methylosinus sp. PW1 TaxID=107636 RepID=UPI0018DD1945|nr:hypothetical protein [Methylosinus sp. PW1]